MRKSTDDLQKIFGEDHADVATIYSTLASAYKSLGEHNQTKELHDKALIIYNKIFGEDHAAVARIYSNLASVYNWLGEYNKAMELHEKALMIYKTIFGEDHASTRSRKIWYCCAASGGTSKKLELKGNFLEYLRQLS